MSTTTSSSSLYNAQNAAISSSVKLGMKSSYSTSPLEVSPKAPVLHDSKVLSTQDVELMDATPAARYYKDTLIGDQTRPQMGILPTGPSALVAEALFLHTVSH